MSVLGYGAHVLMAQVSLPARHDFHLPTSRCQEALVFVEQGTLHAGDVAIAEGTAARLAGGAGQVTAGETDTRLFVAFIREWQSGFGSPPSWDFPPACRAMPPTIAQSDPNTSGPFSHSDGALQVHVYLDGPHQQAKLGSLGTLDGDPTLGVPEHLHETSDEVLWFREGSGTMRLGDKQIAIRPDTFVYVPPKTVHGFTPDGTSRVFAYQVYTPSGPEQRFLK